MSGRNTNGKLHRRLGVFIRWIATDAEREDEIRERMKNVRTAIRSKAAEDDLIVRSTPSAGSFATRTGLRRHMRGKSEVEGQDVDLPFVIAPKTKNDERLDVLLPRLEKYAREAFPDTKREVTKSSVKLLFTDKVNFDLVPLLATNNSERQLLVRSDGERRETSVHRHVEFVTSRTARSNDQRGRVKFNELVLLLKWWRCFREAEAGSVKEVPSFLVNLLAAHAFDQRGVQETYGETIADWFGLLAHTARERRPVFFTDYGQAPASAPARWAVYDPVNPENNIVETWTGLMCDEFTEWLEESRDAMYDSIAAFDDDRESDGLECLVRVFGTPIRHHSELKE